jgi:hypothetical protein
MATELQTAMQGFSESQSALNGAVVVIADKLKDTIDSVGQADGVASLGSDGKVPSGQLPSLDYIPTSAKATANGVASLDATGKLPESQLPSQTMALIYAAL